MAEALFHAAKPVKDDKRGYHANGGAGGRSDPFVVDLLIGIQLES